MIKQVAVTGGMGQIAYSLLFRIASGELFGKECPISLNILEIPECIEPLKGVVMELEDCAFPHLNQINISADPFEIFADADIAILIGAKPRGAGMERSALLKENGTIFAEQGAALNAVAAKNVTVFVVGNPCNTNCLITMHNAPRIPRNQFYAMSRLDQNRARFQLAKKAKVPIDTIENIIIWGNHSTTQVPDFVNGRIGGKKITEIIDRSYLENDFIQTVQKRGGEVITKRGKSSAASAANAIIDGLHDLFNPGLNFSSCMCSDGNPYGVEEDLIFSFPCVMTNSTTVCIAKDFEIDPFLKEKLALTEQELIEERDAVKQLLN